MIRALSAVIALAASFSLVACKKESPPESVPVSVSAQSTAATATTPAAPASGTPAAAADAGAEGGTDDAGTPALNPTVTTPVKGQSVDACCAALSSAQSKDVKAKLAERRAAQICAGVAGRVKSGETSRAAGLNLIRGSLAGAPIPAACR
jgi:hypothetical protein